MNLSWLPSWLRVVIYALAVFRLTHLVLREAGPFDIFVRLRALLGAYERLEVSKNGEVIAIQTSKGFWTDLFSCPYCLSGWFAIIAAVGLASDFLWLDLIALWLCVWAIVFFVFRALERGEG